MRKVLVLLLLAGVCVQMAVAADIFAAAEKGNTELVQSLLQSNPGLANARGDISTELP